MPIALVVISMRHITASKKYLLCIAIYPLSKSRLVNTGDAKANLVPGIQKKFSMKKCCK
jgi:hypothetical protein